MRKALSLLVAVVFVLGAMVVVSSAGTNNGAEKYTLSKCQKRKAPVSFNHWQHQKIQGVTCKTCHHKLEAGKAPRSCFQCHPCTGRGAEGAPKAMMAFHKNCKGCHAKMKREGKAAGPTRCSGCHVKK